MTAAIVSQAVAEVLSLPSPHVQVSQTTAAVLIGGGPNLNAVVSQATAVVLSRNNLNIGAQVDQAVAEVLSLAKLTEAQVDQAVIEVLSRGIVIADVDQVVAEVLSRNEINVQLDQVILEVLSGTTEFSSSAEIAINCTANLQVGTELEVILSGGATVDIGSEGALSIGTQLSGLTGDIPIGAQASLEGFSGLSGIADVAIEASASLPPSEYLSGSCGIPIAARGSLLVSSGSNSNNGAFFLLF